MELEDDPRIPLAPDKEAASTDDIRSLLVDLSYNEPSQEAAAEPLNEGPDLTASLMTNINEAPGQTATLMTDLNEAPDLTATLMTNLNEAPGQTATLVPALETPRVHAQPQPQVEGEDPDRIRIELPIRVIGFDDARGRFIEDTHTIVVSNTGSLIALQHKVFPADIIRLINLENMEESDFRIVGPSIVSETAVSQWGVECTDGRNIWGFPVPASLSGIEGDSVLKCKACGNEIIWKPTLLEIEVLARTGMIAMPCVDCKKPTYWIYADVSLRPKGFALADVVAPPPRVVPIRERAERRKVKRVMLKLPILVRRKNGQTETTNTQDMSKQGCAVSLAMELDEGETIMVMVPYHPDGTNIPQRAQMMWKDPYPSSGRRWHGLKFVR